MSIKKIDIYGNASKKVITTLFVNEIDLKLRLLDFLRKNGLPIAYSCDGHGSCRKCSFNKDILSCQITVEDYLKSKEGLLIFDYL
ncbi:MAG: 2Fe-2S iron-sulfur cluster binding domain-containing protein [Bdellovibrionales bacterium]|jgi:Na+-transporting NADH:ubiquinone oxidoreductase subunit NqrF|nr:2Fe-2S iron-sulfur cluster binding domain-containing protein [Bdellovibrionales bacterium]